MTFQRFREDFTCAHCGTEVIGNGYTDHCPACLWGKHVDIDPGDRASTCDGMMKPIDIIALKGGTRIAYICERCKHKFQVRRVPDDNDEVMLALSKQAMHDKGAW